MGVPAGAKAQVKLHEPLVKPTDLETGAFDTRVAGQGQERGFAPLSDPLCDRRDCRAQGCRVSQLAGSGILAAGQLSRQVLQYVGELS